jgi:hypothetical protein
LGDVHLHAEVFRTKTDKTEKSTSHITVTTTNIQKN